MKLVQYIQVIDIMLEAMKAGIEPNLALFNHLYAIERKMITGKGRNAKFEEAKVLSRQVGYAFHMIGIRCSIQRLETLKAILLDEQRPYAF